MDKVSSILDKLEKYRNALTGKTYKQLEEANLDFRRNYLHAVKSRLVGQAKGDHNIKELRRKGEELAAELIEARRKRKEARFFTGLGATGLVAGGPVVVTNYSSKDNKKSN